jgi:16S rRNA (guanine1516-N2)-methyltransferase
MDKFLCVTACESEQSRANQFAARHAVPFVTKAQMVEDLAAESFWQFELHFAVEKLELIAHVLPTMKPLSIDFQKTLDNRIHSKQAGLYQDPMVKACGVKKGQRLDILDATCGLGRDACVLASLGANVIALERSYVLHALLQDGLQRAPVEQLQLVQCDAATYLQHLSEDSFPDVVYLDPMFPEKNKSALVKKDMQILQHFLDHTADAVSHETEALLKLARTRVKKRVVLKRPAWAAEIHAAAINFQLHSRQMRFDVYLPIG